MAIKGKPNLDAFLEGAETKQPGKKVVIEKTAVLEKPVSVVLQVQKATQDVEKKKSVLVKKLVNIPEPLFKTLKDHAWEEYKKTGVRVSENQIIVEALSRYFNI